ncbi:Na+/H+ antiporter [Ancylobacter sp.]|uniref:Na+/H+ antiporter n=1 Tax=Ancylobacter sp. TaxID=1872567 RepID=UPI003D0D3722
MGGRVALPLVQIAVGAALGYTGVLSVRLEPELFFLLFLPPLLFLDGWRVPQQDLKDNAVTILSLAFGLVLITVLGIGLMVHLMVPAMPLAVCFALAAVLSPTDIVAATSMITDMPMPRRVLRILEGEALFNDASGLVCLRVAVAVAMTGVFDVWSTAAHLLWAAVGGVVIGLALSRLISLAKLWVATQLGEDTSSQIVISLLTPYAAYLLADALGGSAVLAAVAAGMMMSRIEVSGKLLAVTRIRRSAVWETLQFTLNGAIFLLLGEQLPGILSRAELGAAESGHRGLEWLALYVLAITVALAAMRFCWVWVSVIIWRWRHGMLSGWDALPNWRLVATMSTAGVRGAVTLAGALSLPLALPDGMPFPSRDLVILIAAGVILVSLVVANASLRPLLRGIEVPPEPRLDTQERSARVEAAKAAIAALAQVKDGAKGRAGLPDAEELAAIALVADYYQHRLSQLQPAEPTRAGAEPVHREEHLHVLAVRAERAAIASMVRGHRISNDLAHKLLRETDLAEAAFQTASEA